MENHVTTNMIFDPVAMKQRRDSYFAFVRGLGSRVFKPDGTYQPTTEPDGRIAYWILPAFLHSTNPADRELGLAAYSAAAGWKAFDIFMTSCVAANLVRHAEDFTPELRTRSEEHLARFTVAGEGRLPSANVYDYMFHGYNDNMPAMATRTMIFAGDILGRREFTDAGLFNLEGLCAHFERRGMLSEFTSATYTPITLCSLLDIAECSDNNTARQLARACTDRILLDILGHWHWETGTTGGTMSRSYTVDHMETLSILNAYMWYVSGSAMTINPQDVLTNPQYKATMHHGRNMAFNLAQFVEVMNASHTTVNPQIRDFARGKRTFPYTVLATADWGDSGALGASRPVQTRSYQQPQWWLASSSTSNMAGIAGQTLVLHGAFATTTQPKSWRDRVAFWPRLVADFPDHGQPSRPGASPHAGEFKGVQQADDPFDPNAESDHVTDWARYHCVQKQGSAMLVGAIGPNADGREFSNLAFGIYFTNYGPMPDEVFENNTALSTWQGNAAAKSWQFLRFGEAYIGVRLSAASHGKIVPIRRALRHGYMRVEVPFLENTPTKIDQAFREWAEFGCLIEMGSKQDAGSFADFRASTLATKWEFHHGFYRNSRSQSRSGELQIVDSVLAGTARFLAVDGVVEPETKLAITGLDPALTRLFPDGERIVQRRTLYRPNLVATPFYDRKSQVLESDFPG
jgi:hypothetical protein